MFGQYRTPNRSVMSGAQRQRAGLAGTSVDPLTRMFIISMLNSMIDILNKRPFTAAIDGLRVGHRYTYQELAFRSCGVRSTAWFNGLINGRRWKNSPPDPDTWSGFAQLLSTDEDNVREMIAEEWFGVGNQSISPRVRGIAGAVDKLADPDFELVAQVVGRLVANGDPRADSPVAS